ncbi:hypothetical protein [Algoriphagus marinus]|uniref:hypothetical protein n=1 Tax=Algoriphagus marinus TaxID=1925762 RepID=UPI00094B90B0|nr:hypothetical protein [Algoriphagus marinus]
MKKILSPVLLLVASLFSSCEKSAESDFESTPTSYSLELLDSLDLEILGDPLIADVSADASKFLFYDFASSDIITTDKKGEILSRFSKKEDTPDAYGFMMEVPGFFKSNQIVVMGMKGIFLYDLEGNMIQKIDHPESVGIAGFMTFPGKSTESTQLDGKDYLLSKSVRSHDSFQGEMKFYTSFKALELIDPESNTIKEIVPFEEGSMFLNGTGYYESDYSPAFESKDGKLYISLGAEQKLYVYDLSPEGTLLDTMVSFSIPGYEPLEPKDFSEFSEGSVTLNGSTPAIRNIHLVDGKILAQYYPGMDPEKLKEAEALWEQGKAEEAGALYEKLEAELPQGILIFDQKTLKLEADIPFPKGVNRAGFTSGGGYLWMEKAANEEEEEDFLRIYKVKLVQK